MTQKQKNILYQTSCIFLIGGIIVFLFSETIGKYITLAGVVGYLTSLLMSPYQGKGLRGKRLTAIRFFAGILMAVSVFFMFRHENIWILLMFIAAIFNLYSSIMIPKALKDEKNSNDNE